MPELVENIEIEMIENADDGRTPKTDGRLAELDLEWVEESLVQVLRSGHDRAFGKMGSVHRRWAEFRTMKSGQPVNRYDFDELERMGVYLPDLAKFCDVMRAQILREVLPDPSAMDFFELGIEFPGFEAWADTITEGLRAKFRLMRPQEAPSGFMDSLDRQIDDLTTLGNCFSLMLYDMRGGGKQGVVHGPVDQYLDAMNVFPWRLDTPNAALIDFTIYNAIDDHELDAGSFRHKDKVRQEVGKKATSRRSPVDEVSGTVQSDREETDFAEPLYERYIYAGRWPGWELRTKLGFTVQDEKINQDILNALIWNFLGKEFGFDPAEASEAEYWDIQWIGQVLVQCRPYVLDLPVGLGPIQHRALNPVNGYLLGHGIYDRGHWDERLKNFFYKCIVRICGINSDPPVKVYRQLIEPEWYQRHGESPRIEPGMAIPVKTLPGVTQNPFEPLYLNEEAIPMIRDQMAMHDVNMRQLTGINTDIEGQSRARTATQAANNLQQSMSLIQYYVKGLEEGFLKEKVQRAYSAWRGVLTMLGGQDAVMLPQGIGPGPATITPDLLVDPSMIRVKMTGSSSPGNRFNMIEAVREFMQFWLPTGVLGADAMAREHAKYLGLSFDKLRMNWPQSDASKIVMQAMATWGSQSLRLLRPDVLAAAGIVPEAAFTQGQGGEAAARAVPSPGGRGPTQQTAPPTVPQPTAGLPAGPQFG